MQKLEYAKLFTNMMSEGFIFIDQEGIIRIYNDSAKEIFGLNNKYDIEHEAGSLEEGDIIIVVNNSLSSDDGNMDFESLKLLGLENIGIKAGDAFISISKYRQSNIDYRVRRDYERQINLKSVFNDINIEGSIDFNKNMTNIRVNDVDFPLEFINHIGHMLVLSGKDYKLKFYQSNGYTARKESINDLLKGKGYQAKYNSSQNMKLIGENIFSIHKSETIIEDFYRVAQGADLVRKDEYEEINGFPSLCTIHPVEAEGKRVGAALRVENISKLEQLIRDRDELLKDLEEVTKNIKEKEDLKSMFKDYPGQSNSIIQAKKMAYRASKTLSNILILGSQGVGKSTMAKIIHRHSSLGEEQFLRLNCSYLNEENFDSSLKSFEKGTVYFEEIGNLSLVLQEKLLRLLDGADSKIRFIFSTAKNLDKMILQSTFNEELYYEINVFPIYIEDLKDRKMDIKPIVDNLLPKVCKQAKVEEKRISKEALDILESYSWPRNIKDLKNVLERAVNLSLGDNILTKHIVLIEDMRLVDDKPKNLKEALEEKEKIILQTSIAKHKGDRKKIIKELGISQSTFYEKLNKYDLN